MLVSVIIPVYNTESYLAECIESVLSQTMRDFELLLVDDGSRDGSGAICDRFAADDDRVRVFHIPNGGVSRARNLGLDNAQGEFVTFIDSDDRVEPNHLQQYIDSGIGEDGVVFSNILEEHAAAEGRKGRVTVFPLLDNEASGGREACMPIIAQLLRAHCFGWACNKLFSSKTIERHGLRFDPSLRYAEDEVFAVQYCAHITHIVTSSRATYHYRYIATSLLHGHKDPLMLMRTRQRIFSEFEQAGYSDEVLYLTTRTQFSRLRRELRHAKWGSDVADQLAQGILDNWQLYRRYARPAFRTTVYDIKAHWIGMLACAPDSRPWVKFIIKGLHL